MFYKRTLKTLFQNKFVPDDKQSYLAWVLILNISNVLPNFPTREFLQAKSEQDVFVRKEKKKDNIN